MAVTGERDGASGADAEELPGFARLELDELREGVALRHPAYDKFNIPLLPAGTLLTSGVLRVLRQRGVRGLRVHHTELARLRRRAPVTSGKASAKARGDSAGENGEVKFSGTLAKIVRHGGKGFGSERVRSGLGKFRESLSSLDGVFAQRREMRAEQHDVFEGISGQSLVQIAEDIDLFVCLGVRPETDGYPARHSLQSAMLGMAMGANLGLDERSIVRLGIGLLAHDAGMLHLNPPVYRQAQPLDRTTFLTITRHPGITFDLMAPMERVAGCSRSIAYQVHERLDGSGYPRGRTESQIHPLARIAMVADVFTAMISPRPYRPALLPYDAMEYLLRGAHQGRFCAQAVRGLLQTVSLFPINSYVSLTDGRVGRVIRANPTDYTRPVVEAWNAEGLEGAPEVVDLASSALGIRRPTMGLNELVRVELRDDEDGETVGKSAPAGVNAAAAGRG